MDWLVWWDTGVYEVTKDILFKEGKGWTWGAESKCFYPHLNDSTVKFHRWLVKATSEAWSSGNIEKTLHGRFHRLPFAGRPLLLGTWTLVMSVLQSEATALHEQKKEMSIALSVYRVLPLTSCCDQSQPLLVILDGGLGEAAATQHSTSVGSLREI